MKIKVNDKVYEGETARDIVTQMSERDFETTNPDVWMGAVERRLKNFKDFTIDFRDDAEFLQELQRIGLIRIVDME